ncbi:hypothetical protein GMRT_12246 [Giardia muris]|uniref:Uncharacterized protein n=1 Tax=Giardia muris TaxID=5742 RepID=A0A4Z1TDH9_GIAMU|nr:hypothetical protein GMRT_12246 [Giardia muris]|eukprot:TNJ30599.1 hypothetical protein GMRT_12246 [Giardia muris]
MSRLRVTPNLYSSRIDEHVAPNLDSLLHFTRDSWSGPVNTTSEQEHRILMEKITAMKEENRLFHAYSNSWALDTPILENPQASGLRETYLSDSLKESQLAQSLRMTIDSQDVRLNELILENQGLKDQVESLLATKEFTDIQLREDQSIHMSLSTRVAEEMEESRYLRSCLEQKDASLSELQHSLESIQQELQTTKTKHKQEHAEWSSQLRRLEEEKMMLEEEVRTWKGHAEAAGVMRRQYERSFYAVLKEMQAGQEKFTGLMDSLARLEERVATAEKGLRKLSESAIVRVYRRRLEALTALK